MEILSSDVIRGHLDAIVLSSLVLSDKYGVELKNAVAQKTNGFYMPNEQSLYSAFHRLERDGLIDGRWGDGSEAKRKYYSITQDGLDYLSSLIAAWENSKALIDLLIKDA